MCYLKWFINIFFNFSKLFLIVNSIKNTRAAYNPDDFVYPGELLLTLFDKDNVYKFWTEVNRINYSRKRCQDDKHDI
jgi:hypothetical protein